MAREFAGKVELDIRDSVPDWDAVPGAEGAEGRAERAVHRVGRRRLRDDGRASAARSQTPNMQPHRRHGRALLELPHDGAVLADTRSSLLTGRNATSNGMATIAEFSSGLPRHLDAHPVRERVHLRGARRARLQHVLRRQVAPHPGRGVQPRRVQGPLAARARASSASTASSAASRTSGIPTSSTTTSQIDAPGDAGGGLPPRRRTSPTRRSGSSRTRRSIDPDKPFFMYLAPGCRARAAPRVRRSGPTSTRATFDEGYEAIRDGILARQKELGLLPDEHRAVADQPARRARRTGPDGQPWPLLDTVRPWDSLSDDEQRLFARMAEVFAGFVSYTDDQLGRVLDYLEDSGQLDNTIIVVVSDNGASGEGGPNGSFNEWRFFNGVADTTDGRRCRTSTSSARPQSYNHYCTGWAWAFDTPFPYWKRWAGYEGGVADMCLCRVAGEDRSRRTTSRQQYVHAVDVVPTDLRPPRHRAARRCSRATRRARSRARASRRALTDPEAPGKATQFYAMLGQRSIYHDGLARLHRAPADRPGGASSTWTCGSSTTSRHDRSQSKNVAAAGAGAARDG